MMRSRSKRAVVYRYPNPPSPLKERDRFGNRMDILFDCRGDPKMAESYVADNGMTLADYYQTHWDTKLSREIRSHRFRDAESLVKQLSRDIGNLEMVEGGVLIPYSGMSNASSDYNRWRRGEVYGVAVVDDPDDSTGDGLYVDDPKDFPGRVVDAYGGPIYGKPEAVRQASRMSAEHSDPSRWRFSVRMYRALGGLTAEEAARYGYDGRRLEPGESMDVGPFSIEREADAPLGMSLNRRTRRKNER